VFAAILLPFVLLSFYARPAADDFSYADSVMKYGFWNAQTYWYTQWSGRFFSTLLVTLFCRPAIMGEAYQLGPLLVMGLLFVGLSMLTTAAFPAGAGKRQVLGVTLAVGLFAVAVVFNDYLYTFTLVSDPSGMTLMADVGSNLVDIDDPGATFAEILLGVAPVAFLCAFFADTYARGLGTGVVR